MKIYQEKIDKYYDETLRIKKVLSRISFLRLLIFIISAVVLITLFSKRLITPFTIVFPLSILCFVYAIKRYNKIAYRSRHISFLKKINESELQRQNCTLEEFDAGHQFINYNHPYTADLDIFGQHSIFQLVNRTTTESGRLHLSEWLSEPATKNEILNRQEAIKELSLKLDWRQYFQASGMHFQHEKSGYKKLLEWVETPEIFLKYRWFYTTAALLLSVLALLSLSLLAANLNSFNGVVYLAILFAVLIINFLILRKVKPTIEGIVGTSQENIDTLKAYRSLVYCIEKEEFKAKKLLALQAHLVQGNYSAFHEINRICKLLEFSQQRPIKKIPIGGNRLYPFLNSFLLIDVYLVIGAEKWKAKNKSFLKAWAEALSEFEVINSFAGFYYSNPSYVFPKIVEKNNYVHFKKLGHPLINADKRVCNNFQSEKPGDITLITGSNMGGKSTFLRSVGVNLVLALAGAPCCAEYAEVSNLQLYTSMRTQDNLKEGISSFYAELERVEKMLTRIASTHNVFFLLDEMFKGTNSEDRHRGGYSLIFQLIGLNTSGIIATHDIELAKLLEKKSLVANYSFNSTMKNNTMHFNYKLQPGICNDFNASELMKKSGIKIITPNKV